MRLKGAKMMSGNNLQSELNFQPSPCIVAEAEPHGFSGWLDVMSAAKAKILAVVLGVSKVLATLLSGYEKQYHALCMQGLWCHSHLPPELHQHVFRGHAAGQSTKHSRGSVTMRRASYL